MQHFDNSDYLESVDRQRYLFLFGILNCVKRVVDKVTLPFGAFHVAWRLFGAENVMIKVILEELQLHGCRHMRHGCPEQV